MPQQPRVIPVQHQQGPANYQPWQNHNPTQMPQPQTFNYGGMPQPFQQQQWQPPQNQYQYPQQYRPQASYQQTIPPQHDNVCTIAQA